MREISLVTGASGLLGSNLVRALRAEERQVRASVRDASRAGPTAGLGAEVVYADLMNPGSLADALAGVDTLYQVAGVFRHWSRDPERDIILPNVAGTRNVLQAAARAGVRRVVYVSSSTTLAPPPGSSQVSERDWRTDFLGNPYSRAKTQAEQVAWEVAGRMGLDMVTVLPSAIVGPVYGPLALSMTVVDRILRGTLPAAPDFHFTYIDARDVARAMIAASGQGRPGERYLLAGDRAMSVTRLAELACQVSAQARVPRVMPAPAALAAATMMESLARLTGRPPALLRSQVRLWCGATTTYDTSKARAELGWQPRTSEQAVRECLRNLADHQQVSAPAHA
jgi:dihydroflavonol-4-reductase